MLIVASGIEARLAPVVVEGAVPPLLEQVVLIFWHPPHRRAALGPGHDLEPGAQVFGGQRFGHKGVLESSRALQRVVEGPGRLLELECTTLPDAAGEGVGEAAGVQHHGRQTRRIEAGQGHLGVGGIGEAHRADLAAAPALPDYPGQRVEAVFTFGQILDELPLGAKAAAAILVDHHIAMADKVAGHFRPGHGEVHPHLDFRAGSFALAIGCPLQDDRERTWVRDAIPGRAVDVGCEPDAIAHGDHDVAMDHYPVSHMLGWREHVHPDRWPCFGVPSRHSVTLA